MKKKETDAPHAPDASDWVVEGLRALAAVGIEGVKVERLATAMGISKGPFYWRFAKRAELLEAMLATWRKEFTAHLIEQSAPLTFPRARIEALLENVLVAKWRGTDVAHVEGAIRAWAAQDPMAQRVVQEVDRLRVSYLVSELGLMGIEPDKAETMAKGIYLALLGLYATRQYTPELADDAALRALVAVWLDQVEAWAAEAEASSRVGKGSKVKASR